MHSYKEILRFLIVREQLSLGWKLGFFVVCAALFIGSGMLFNIKGHSVDLVGTVASHGATSTEEGHGSYLMILLDNGATVRARPLGALDYRPGHRVVVREITTNFFGLKRYEFKGYIDKANPE
jgi:hypothetical protein